MSEYLKLSVFIIFGIPRSSYVIHLDNICVAKSAEIWYTVGKEYGEVRNEPKQFGFVE
jgi:hypothetical protein